MAGSVTRAVFGQMLFQISEAHNALFIASHPHGFELAATRRLGALTCG